MFIIRVVDFTHIIENGMSVYCSEEDINIEKVADIDSDKFESKRVNIFTHTGTHIDSPRHMLNSGKYINEYKLEELIGKCIIINIQDTNCTIEKSILKKYESSIKKADFVLINTGWNKYWNTNEYLNDYPTLTVEAAKYIASFNIKAVGVDCISIGKRSNEIELHKIFFDKGILIIENLNFQETIEEMFDLIIAPLHVKDSDGAPIRIFGIKV